MSKRDIIAAALKVYGVVVVSAAVIYSPNYIGLVFSAPRVAGGEIGRGAAAVMYIGPLALALVVGLLLILYAECAGRWLASNEPVGAVAGTSARELLAAALAVVGVVVLVGGVISFAREIANSLISAHYWVKTGRIDSLNIRDMVMEQFWVGRRTSVVQLAVSLLLGGLLALKARPIAEKLTSEPSSKDP